MVRPATAAPERKAMFDKIVIVEPVLITDEGRDSLYRYARQVVAYDTCCRDDAETIERIGDADCILVSYRTVISGHVLENCPKLRFISLCCSYYGPGHAVVDTVRAAELGIGFAALQGHGDNGVVEYTLSQVINLLQGTGPRRWRDQPYDLTGVRVGILGLGDLGYKTARAFMALGAPVWYYSRTRKKDKEEEQLRYLPLEDLLATADVLSVHLNRDVCLLDKTTLPLFSPNRILVNTAVGCCCEPQALKKWLETPDNFYIFDKVSLSPETEALRGLPNVFYADHITGDTRQCYQRATSQILNNLDRFLRSHG